jgi:hypothetical protein
MVSAANRHTWHSVHSVWSFQEKKNMITCYHDTVITLSWYHDNGIMLSCYHDTVIMLSWYHYHVIMITLSWYYDNMLSHFFFAPENFTHCTWTGQVVTIQTQSRIYRVSWMINLQRKGNDWQPMHEGRGGGEIPTEGWKRGGGVTDHGNRVDDQCKTEFNDCTLNTLPKDLDNFGIYKL